ncbi:hypothetical protein [Brevibacterium moorei]|uniref:hypothetical protein n=1 Tax=Brevibacterium moorei TaxID=2968457 RepID=UPI00211C17CB|nr:hypothetical protein [Brevibacterium sp. 68QC2CO]
MTNATDAKEFEIWAPRVRPAIVAALAALERASDADKSCDAETTVISAVETAMWLRTLWDIFEQHLDRNEDTCPAVPEEGIVRPNFPVSYFPFRTARGLRIVGNKGLRELIFPTRVNPRLSFLSSTPRQRGSVVGPLSSRYNFGWQPRDKWELSHERKPRKEDIDSFDEAVSGQDVVRTLAVALGSYRERASMLGIDLSDLFDAEGQPHFVHRYLG